MSLKAIKNKIRSIDKTHQVTKAMEAVSAVKMRKSQERALSGRAYATSALTILQKVSGSFDGKKHSLGRIRTLKRVCIVVVTSDKGLAGNLNNAVLRKTMEFIKGGAYEKANIECLCMGKKAKEYFLKRDFNVTKSFENIADGISSDDMREITEYLIKRFTGGAYDECFIIYTNFLSTFEQEAIVRRLLPFSRDALEETVRGIRPVRGVYSERVENKNTAIVAYTIEPNPEDVLNELLPFLLNIEMYHALLESKASEHSARMVAMKNASDKAGEISEELNLQFNKERQALITREVSEITSGMREVV